MPRKIFPLQIKIPQNFLSSHRPNNFSENEFCSVSGQPSAIRFFDPDSVDDYHTLSDILGHKDIKTWMDDTGRLSRSDYRFWSRNNSTNSFLFAVHDTRVPRDLFNTVRGFVNIYSERSEKFRIKRMIINGLLPKRISKKHILEISMAAKPAVSGESSGSGLISSALRLSCLQIRAILNHPKQSNLIIYAFIDPKNLPSVRAIEAAGFVMKGSMKYSLNSSDESHVYILSWPRLNKKINKNLYKINLLLNPQITDSHCGPAVIQNLLAYNHISVKQDDIVNVAKVNDTIAEHGMRPSQISQAVTKLAPKLQVLFKQNATAKDIMTLIRKYKIPVAVDWQGLFYNSVQEEKKYSTTKEHGHYSIVIDLDTRKDEITIADPYSEYYQKPRVFSFTWFKSRWWDSDKIVNSKTKKTSIVSTKKMIFIIVPKKTILSVKLQPKP